MRLFSNSWPYLLPDSDRSTPVAYLLWLMWGFFGLHKLYLGKPGMAMLYVLTGSFFGLGWFFDMVTLPLQVDWFRMKRRMLQIQGGGEGMALAGTHPAERPPQRPEEIMMALLGFARDNRGAVTVTEGVIATGAPFKKVESVLREMATSGYVEVRNDPETGVVRYLFPELVPTAFSLAGTP